MIVLPNLAANELLLRLNEDITQVEGGPLDPQRVGRALILAVNHLETLMANQLRSELLTYYDFPLADQTTGDMGVKPPDCYRVVTVTRIGSENAAPALQEFKALRHVRMNGPDPNYMPGVYEVRGNRYYNIGNKGARLRMWYTRRPAMMHWGPIAATAPADANSLPMRVVPSVGRFDYTKNIYNGVPVYIYQGTALGSLATISSVNNSTRVATCESAYQGETQAFSSVLSHTGSDTSYYTLVPRVDALFEDLVILLACEALKGAIPEAEKLMGAAARLMVEFYDWMASEDAGSPVRVQPDATGDDFDFGMG